MTLPALLRDVVERLRHPESFMGALLTLVSGTAIAHLITAAALLVLARLYSPHEFGVLGLFTGIFFILSVVACLRFDVAIPLADSDEEAFALLHLCFLSACVVAAFCALAVLLAPALLLQSLGFGEVAPYIWLLPFALLANGIFVALQSWAVRRKDFPTIARARIAQSAGAAAAQIGIGLGGSGPVGLILGTVTNAAAGIPFVAKLLGRQGRVRNVRPDRKALLHAFRKNSPYLRYSVWEALANSASIQVPLLTIGALASEKELGWLLYAMTILQAPLALLGTATAQIFASRAPDSARKGELAAVMKQTTIRLAYIGAIPIIVMGALSPFVFPLLFGEEWTRSGWLALWMMPWFLLQFLASPTTVIVHIVGRHRLAMVLQIAGLAFRATAVLGAHGLWAGWLSESYAVSGAVFYGLILMAGFWFAKTHDAAAQQARAQRA
jgi:O-antigen/teichoic acid export membrane protein